MDESRASDAECRGFAPYQPSRARTPPSDLIRIRSATINDLLSIMRVQAEAERPAATMSSLEQAISDPEREVVVGTMESMIVGWAKTHYWDHSDGPAAAGHYLGGVTVAPNSRRRGVADALTAARLQWISQRATQAWYVVNAKNMPSMDLHRRWGFHEVARSDRFHSTNFSGGEGIFFCAVSRDGSSTNSGGFHSY